MQQAPLVQLQLVNELFIEFIGCYADNKGGGAVIARSVFCDEAIHMDCFVAKNAPRNDGNEMLFLLKPLLQLINGSSTDQITPDIGHGAEAV